jgi:acyl-CoA thioester hydrolase
MEARVRIAIRWRDIDMLGHLNQAVYHEFLEEGRTALFEQLRLMGDFAFVLARVELDYRREIRRDHGTVDVLTRPATIGRSSIAVDHEIVLPDGTVAAEGRSSRSAIGRASPSRATAPTTAARASRCSRACRSTARTPRRCLSATRPAACSSPAWSAPAGR